MTTAPWTVDRSVAEQCLNLLLSANRVCLPTHENIDADGLASAMAMSKGLQQLGGKSFVLISDGRFPSNLLFLPGSQEVTVYGKHELPEYDLLCLIDSSDQRRLGKFHDDDPNRVSGIVPIINIDHHVTNGHYGVIDIVEPTAGAVAEIVADLLEIWGVVFTLDLAQCLLAGIYGDTLGLRTDTTTARTIRTAARLVDAGASPSMISDALFRFKSVSTVCLWRRALDSVDWTGSLIWTEVSRQMLFDCNADASEAEGLVNFLAGTEGSNVAAIMYENDIGWRVSMRTLSPKVDVAQIAAEFGGGGHPKAAGCQVAGGPAERDQFLWRVAELAATAAKS
jgi:phosphoesterase RecJ-like protein